MGCAAEYRFVCVHVYTHVNNTCARVQPMPLTPATHRRSSSRPHRGRPRFTRRVISPHHHHHHHAHTRSVGGPDSVNTGAQVHTGPEVSYLSYRHTRRARAWACIIREEGSFHGAGHPLVCALCDQAKKLVKNAAKLVKLGVDPSLPPKLKHIIS